MKVAVLASANSWYVRDLVRAADESFEIVPLSHAALCDGLGGAEFQVAPRPADLDAVLVRTMPPGSLEQVVFRMDVLGRWAAQGAVVVNPPRAIEATVDKYLALVRCEAAGLHVPPTLVCQSAEAALQAFDELGGDVVLKPLFGGEGRGICRLSDPDLALRAFKTLEQLNAVFYLQRFIRHTGCDLRLFVLGDRVWGMRRQNALDWRTNVSRGAQTEGFTVTPELKTSALAAARAVGAEIAGVDVLPGEDGEQYVLEVNGVPGWKALSRTLQVDMASEVLFHLAQLTRGKELFV